MKHLAILSMLLLLSSCGMTTLPLTAEQVRADAAACERAGMGYRTVGIDNGSPVPYDVHCVRRGSRPAGRAMPAPAQEQQ